jgi:hypothetical protein
MGFDEGTNLSTLVQKNHQEQADAPRLLTGLRDPAFSEVFSVPISSVLSHDSRHPVAYTHPTPLIPHINISPRVKAGVLSVPARQFGAPLPFLHACLPYSKRCEIYTTFHSFVHSRAVGIIQHEQHRTNIRHFDGVRTRW